MFPDRCKCCGHELFDMRYSIMKALGIELRFYFRMDEDWIGELDKMRKKHNITWEEELFIMKDGMK